MKYRFIRFPEGRTKAVTFSYDDGCRQDLRTVKVLDKNGLKCTFNINSARIGKTSEDWRITADEIQENMLDKGHEIAVHGAWHKAPGKARPIEGIQDVLNDRLELEKIFGRIIRGMAYPDSGIRSFTNQASLENIRNYLKDLDIAYARTLGQYNNLFELPSDWYQWMPTAHHNQPEIFEWAKEFVEMDVDKLYCADREAKLFYIWGHSFEFDSKNNWEQIENICEKLANNPEIWYATNIEIYDYVQAYNRLETSFDQTMVHNPSAIDVWFENKKQIYCVKAGETVRI